MIHQVFPLFGVIRHRQNIHLAKGEAAHVLVEVNKFLERHAVGRSAVVGSHQLLLVIHLVDVLPPASRKRLQDRWPADEIEQPIPIHRVFQIAQRFGVQIHIRRIALLREQDRLGNRDAKFCRDSIVEELVVGRPPEGIVDDISSFEHGMLQKAAIIFDLVGDAVHDHTIAGRFAHARAAQLDHVARDSFLRAELVHFLQEGRRKAVLAAAQKSNFHVSSFRSSGLERRARGAGILSGDTGASFRHDILHHCFQVTSFLVNAQLAFRARAFP